MKKSPVKELAIEGGKPVRAEPFPPRRLFGQDEKAAAVAVFDEAIESGHAFGYGGPREKAYEAEFAESMGGGLAKGVNSGTSAVLAAVAALELEPGSEVICPPITDPGGVMPVAMMNCVPVPADTNEFSFNAGPEQIQAAISERTRAITVAHIMGEPVDMAPVMELARRHSLPVIEDCAQAHGATYRGRKVGTWGDVAVFSTMSGKHYASGAQGGVVFTRNEELFWKARRFMDRGKPFGLDEKTNVVMGLNLNSNELAAAIARVQLRKLPEIVKRRREVAAAIGEGMKSLKSVRPGRVVEQAEASYWFMRVTVDAAKLTVDKDTFAEALEAEGIPLMACYGHAPSGHVWFRQRRTYGRSGCPWTCPHYAGPGDAKYELPNCQAVVASNFLISTHENWGADEVRDTLAALAKVERAYLKR